MTSGRVYVIRSVHRLKPKEVGSSADGQRECGNLAVLKPKFDELPASAGRAALKGALTVSWSMPETPRDHIDAEDV
jgi:hypothetical protein